jgi:hypothetical protein
MKTQFLLLLVTLTTFSVYSQKQFEGSWTTPTSDYVTIISVGEYGVSNVVNYDFKEDGAIVERIIKRRKNIWSPYHINYKTQTPLFVNLKETLKINLYTVEYLMTNPLNNN